MRVRSILFLAVAAVAAALLAAWLLRARLVQDYALSELRRRGVPAVGKVVDIQSDRLVLRDARIGDPAAPDLVARRVEVRFALDGDTPRITGVRAEGAVLRIAVDADGQVRMGAIDRLLPPPTGEPPRLPDIDIAIENGAIIAATPIGLVRAAISGEGNPAGRFVGRARLRPAKLSIGACQLPLRGGDLALAARDRRGGVGVAFDFGTLDCEGVRAEGARLEADIALTDPIAGGKGRIALTLAQAEASGVGAEAVRLACAGRTRASPEGAITGTDCDWTLAADALRYGDWTARGLRHAAPLLIHIGSDGPSAAWSRGPLAIDGIAAGPATRTALARATQSLALTPLGPIEEAVRRALARAAADIGGATEVEATLRPGRGFAATATGARLIAGSGARLNLEARLAFAHGGFAPLPPFDVDIGGGGLPPMRARVSAATRSAQVDVPAWSAGGSRLEPTTLAIELQTGGARIAGPVELSGPLGPGRVTGLSLALADISLLSDGDDMAITLNRCTPVRVSTLAQPRYTLTEARADLCPEGTLLRMRGDRLSGGFTMTAFATAGMFGETPFRLDLPSTAATIAGTADRPVVALNARPATAIASLDSEAQRFDLERFTATASSGPAGWRFAGALAGGRTAAGAAQLSAASGDWSLDEAGRLRLSGGSALIRDPAPRPAFAPLRLAGATADYADGATRFAARVLHAPTATGLGGVEGEYATAIGSASIRLDLAVPFSPTLQPYQLSESARGQIENAAGTVTLIARLAYANGTLSGPGTIATDALDFATAALGPVTGLRTSLQFTDLPTFRSPPGQLVQVASVNPGIEFSSGEAAIHLLGERTVRIERLTFPFAGGTLRLQPTMINPAAPEREFKLAVEGLDIAQIVNLLKIENLNATGRFDGMLPLRFSALGSRIENGRLVARAPGGTLRYVGELGDDLPSAARLAFDALKSMRYSALSLGLNGDLDGEIVTDLRFSGENVAPVRAGGPAALPPGVPFRFNISIAAPLRRLLGSVGGFTDARPLIQQGLDVPPGPETPFSAP